MLKHLWKIENNQTLVLDLREILKYNEFAIIYNRDKTNGKLQAHNEFKYIDFHANRAGVPIISGFSASETHAFAIKHSNLSDKYLPDDAVKKAIRKAKELNSGVIEDMIDTTIAALRVSAKVATHAKELMESLESTARTVDEIQAIIKLSDVVVDMANTIPMKVKKLLELKDEYDKQESKSLNTKRGGGEVTESFDGGGFEKSDDSGKVEKLD